MQRSLVRTKSRKRRCSIKFRKKKNTNKPREKFVVKEKKLQTTPADASGFIQSVTE